jgi:dolichol-phosphate mannosyltransferase
MSVREKEIRSEWVESEQEISSVDEYITIEDITVLIPTLNEEEAISLVINDVRTQGYDNILVVDGHSTDRTAEIVKEQNVKMINQEGLGKTGAIKTAIEHIRTPYFVVLDGDCTYGALDIENLLDHMEDNKQIIGARKKGRENISRLNRFGNWVINKTFNLIFGTNLTDVCSGMYVLNTEFVKSIPFETKGFAVEAEIAAYASYHGNVSEYPINFYQRVGDQKLQPFRDGFRIMKSIAQIGFSLYPARVLSLLAISLFFPGIILLSYPFLISLFSYQLSSIILGLIMIVISIQGVTLYFVDTKVKSIKNNKK